MKVAKTLLALLLLGSVSAVAEPIEIRSGDHEQFTRIVIYADEQLPRSVQENGEQIDVTFSTHIDGFLTDGIFDRITRSRMNSIETSKNTVSLGLNCSCATEVFFLQPNLLVIDIFDEEQISELWPGEPTASQSISAQELEPIDLQNPLFHTQQSPFMNMQKESDVRGNAKDIVALDDVTPTFEAKDILTLPINPNDVSKKKNQVQIRQDLRNDENVSNFPEAISRREELEHLLQERLWLTSQLAKAIERGLLESVSAEVAHSVAGSESIDTTVPIKRVKSQESVWQNRNELLTFEDSPPVKMEIETNRCWDPKLFSIGDWVDSREPAAKWLTPNANLFDSKDKPNNDEIIALARRYLYFGLLEEAENISLLAGSEIDEVSALTYIIESVKGGLAPESNREVNRNTCEFRPQPWNFIRSPQAQVYTQTEINSILKSVRLLPKELRDTVAHVVASKLLDLGYRTEAQLAARSSSQFENLSIVRAPNRSSGSILILSRGSQDQKTVAEGIRSNKKHSATSLIQFVDQLYTAKAKSSRDFEILVEAMHHEFRNTDIGAYLTKSLVTTYALNDQYSDAIEVIAGFSDNDAKLRTHATNRFWNILTDQAGDVAFLRYTLGNRFITRPEKNSQTYLAMVDRLNSLGFEIENAAEQDEEQFGSIEVDSTGILGDTLFEGGLETIQETETPRHKSSVDNSIYQPVESISLNYAQELADSTRNFVSNTMSELTN